MDKELVAMLLFVVIVIIIIGTIAFIHGASAGKPEWCQRQLDDEQMEAVSKKQKTDFQYKNRKTRRNL